jgi:hypothetical protein
MKINIINIENNEILCEIKIQKNYKSKTLHAKIKEALNSKYNVDITTIMMYGKIDIATSTQEIHYRLFGKELPFNNIDIVEVNA